MHQFTHSGTECGHLGFAAILQAQVQSCRVGSAFLPTFCGMIGGQKSVAHPTLDKMRYMTRRAVGWFCEANRHATEFNDNYTTTFYSAFSNCKLTSAKSPSPITPTAAFKRIIFSKYSYRAANKSRLAENNCCCALRTSTLVRMPAS